MVHVSANIVALPLSTPPSNDNPQDTPSELPSYQSTQLLQDTVNLRLRTTNISAPAHSTFDSLKPAVIDFVDTLQAYLEESTGTLIVPPAPENNISSNIRYTLPAFLPPSNPLLTESIAVTSLLSIPSKTQAP